MSIERQIILETVRNALSSDPSFQSNWENVVQELVSTNSVNDPQSIAQQIRKSGVVEQVLKKLRPQQAQSKSIIVASINDRVKTDKGNVIISPEFTEPLDHIPVLFTVKKASGLVDYGAVESLPPPDRPVIQLVVCYSGLRFVSDLYLALPEISFSPETQIAFNVPLPKSPTRNLTEYLLNARHCVFVYLLEYRQTSESWISTLKMHGSIEWRHCLHSPSSSSNQPLRVDLKGIGEVAQQSLGMLEVETKIGPPVPEFSLDSDVVALHLTVESSKRTEAERAFINYARIWHKDFIELSPSLLARRAVKLFVHDERGAVRCPSSLIQSFAPGRLIETPQQCARFVSLFNAAPRELHSGTMHEQDDVWFSVEASLVSSTTTSGGRAVLLCSFLLGLGLDAFVCVGRATSTDVYEEEEIVRTWVMTTMHGADDSASPERVVFWDPLSGSSFVVRPRSASVLQQCPFRTLDCIFSHELFLANIQPDNKISDVSFDLNDNEKWRALDVSACPQVDRLANSAPLKLQPWSNRRFGNNFSAMADWLEEDFARLFAEHRHNLALPRSELDQRLSVALSMALSSYEMASNFGSNFVMSKDFIMATRNIVPSGCVLRAVPLQLPLESVSSPTRAFTSALTRCQAARDVVELPGHMVHHAIRVKIVPYAEKVAAVWLMLAAYTRPG